MCTGHKFLASCYVNCGRMRHKRKFGEMASGGLRDTRETGRASASSNAPGFERMERVSIHEAACTPEHTSRIRRIVGPNRGNPPRARDASPTANRYLSQAEMEGFKITDRHSQINAFLIDTPPIRITSNSFHCITGACSNRHSSEPQIAHSASVFSSTSCTSFPSSTSPIRSLHLESALLPTSSLPCAHTFLARSRGLC